jgi:hypothetical protein
MIPIKKRIIIRVFRTIKDFKRIRKIIPAPEINEIQLKYNILKFLCLIPKLNIIIFMEIVAICQNRIYVKSKKSNLENTESRISSKNENNQIEIIRKK